MGRSVANNITQSGGTEWSKRDKSTYDPTDDIEAYALNASGVVNIIVFDPKGWALFRSFKAVREKLDTRRGSHSELETAVKDLGEAVSYKGMYGDTAIVVYSGQYVENDVKKNFLPDNTMVLGNTQARGLRTYMGTSATMTSGEQSGAVIRGVFDDPENISYAGQGVRVEGSSPSLFVRTDDVRQLRRGDTLTIGEENFWIDRVSPDDGGSCHLWLGRGVPPAVNRRR